MAKNIKCIAAVKNWLTRKFGSSLLSQCDLTVKSCLRSTLYNGCTVQRLIGRFLRCNTADASVVFHLNWIVFLRRYQLGKESSIPSTNWRERTKITKCCQNVPPRNSSSITKLCWNSKKMCTQFVSNHQKDKKNRYKRSYRISIVGNNCSI